MTSSYLYLNSLRVHFLHWNLGDGGQPVVLLHGLASNARIWELVAPALAQAGLMLFAPDARGHGLTDKPDGDYGFETFFHDLAAFIEACHLERPLLVGHSWGAQVALDYAARRPLGPGAPSGLVLVDGGMTQLDDYPGATWETTREKLAPPRLAGIPLEDFLSRLKRGQAGWRPDDQTIPIILANFEVGADDTIAPHLTFEHHMQIVRAMWDFKTYSSFPRLRCPVLMVPARLPQPHSPGETEYMAYKENGIEQAQAAIPNLQVHWMEESVHDIPLQHPAALAGLIASFTASLPSGIGKGRTR
jgi:pimeloyl-ACP methyl ester carboxylesterase